MLRNPNSELVHSPEVFACLEGVFPLLLARPHHRHCHARHHCRCQLRCLFSPLRCATPRSYCSRSSRIHSNPCSADPSGPSLQSATSFQLGVVVCEVAYCDARAHNLILCSLKQFKQDWSYGSLYQDAYRIDCVLSYYAMCCDYTAKGSTYEADMDTGGEWQVVFCNLDRETGVRVLGADNKSLMLGGITTGARV